MIEFFEIMKFPFLACLILTGIHVYFGIHIIERKVIFADLALAQMAALGTAIALVMGLEPHSPWSFAASLSATMLGGVILALIQPSQKKVPHEAFIGVVYVFAAAAAVLVMSRSTEGDEHIRHMLVGNILLVCDHEVYGMTLLYLVVGLIHWFFRKSFWSLTTQPEKNLSKNQKILWDVFFYVTFGIVVTSSVKIAGVLLVFSFLIVPSIIACYFSENIFKRLLIGWLAGTFVSAVGMAASYFFDLPTGAAIVCAFGSFLFAAALIRKLILR